MDEDWQADLERWLAPYLEVLGNKTRRRMCPAYIAGLIGPGDRKSIQPMAARSDVIAHDWLHHFIGAGLWDSAPLEVTLWRQADELSPDHPGRQWQRGRLSGHGSTGLPEGRHARLLTAWQAHRQRVHRVVQREVPGGMPKRPLVHEPG
jgi:hypothetical protein